MKDNSIWLNSFSKQIMIFLVIRHFVKTADDLQSLIQCPDSMWLNQVPIVCIQWWLQDFMYAIWPRYKVIIHAWEIGLCPGGARDSDFRAANHPPPPPPPTHTHTHTVHMALVGYFIVFSFVTKPGQTLEFLLWGTIVPLNFLVGYYCSIVASTPQPMAYASTRTVHMALVGYFIVFSFVTKPGQTLEFLLWGTIVLLLQVPHNPMAYASTHTNL